MICLSLTKVRALYLLSFSFSFANIREKLELSHQLDLLSSSSFSKKAKKEYNAIYDQLMKFNYLQQSLNDCTISLLLSCFDK